MRATSPHFAGVVRRRVLIALTLDAIAVAIAVALAAEIARVNSWGVLAAFAIAVRMCTAASTQAYRVSWYLFCYRDAVRLSAAWIMSAPLVALTWWWAGSWPSIWSFVQAIFIEAVLSYALVMGMRAAARGKTESKTLPVSRIMSGPSTRAVVVGAGAAATMVIRELAKNTDLNYEVVGIVDDDTRKWGACLDGIRIHGAIDTVSDVARVCDADCIILAMPSVGGERISAILAACQTPGVPVYTVPGLGELLTGKVQISRIRPLEMEDLLGRQPARIGSEQWQEVSSRFRAKSIMVTGAGGSIGSELCRQLVQLEPSALVMVENNENNLFEIHQEIRKLLPEQAQPELVDIRDEARLRELFERSRPQVVFHAAAFKHVPMMERHPQDAILNNVGGTRNVAQLAHEYRAEHFVQISTDKAVNPTNVMGASKRVAEMQVQSLSQKSDTKFSCVRFGNVLGSRGSVIHTFQRQIAAGGPVTVTDPEVTRFFMTIPEAVSLVIQAGARGQGGEIFLLDMGEPVKIVDLARSMIRLSGRRESEIPISFVGLRPGEKLYEELLLDGEGIRPSGLPKIHLAACTAVQARKLHELVELLLETANAGDERQIRRILVGAGIGFRPGIAAQEKDRDDLATLGASKLSRGALDVRTAETSAPSPLGAERPSNSVPRAS